ncbi:single-stranded DNA-binding protein [Tepidibacillus infernus]|uniref:Single-stranded DNA-binding protein n=1 Tax=Tepidibacillus decaturensis TaxID=1413211 RepID=A0A135L7H3_9BACI|nr:MULTISPECIES: single-stranded DNA-binding protein [Tepidibacillus]KXG44773.1 single-stranded DNA-binding protein [Tepidibacillus decaturensis]GBF11538.1 single-stranded DNA-binding protein ssb [Tepidibacillus sp. HK-1]
MLNRVILIGRLTRDPELRYTPSGVAVSTFTLAVDRNYTNQQGQREADFINIVTWRGLAENVANYLKKGRLTAVEGRIQTRHYDNNEGKRVYVTEVVADNVRFLESSNNPKNDPFTSGFNQNDRYDKGQDPFADDGSPIDISDDDLPF